MGKEENEARWEALYKLIDLATEYYFYRYARTSLQNDTMWGDIRQAVRVFMATRGK